MRVEHASAVAAGEQFECGENWRRFLRRLNAERIAWAERSLANLLELERLDGKTFLAVFNRPITRRNGKATPP